MEGERGTSRIPSETPSMTRPVESSIFCQCAICNDFTSDLASLLAHPINTRVGIWSVLYLLLFFHHILPRSRIE
jgi:hypothetical protein